MADTVALETNHKPRVGGSSPFSDIGLNRSYPGMVEPNLADTDSQYTESVGVQ